jgi:antitoxin component YwqK of YwqJK toxin-antitoxin module
MHKIYPYLIIILGLSIISCQGESNIKSVKDDQGNVVESYAIDEAGLKHGVFKTFDTEGNLTEEAEYNHGKLNGYRRIFRSDKSMEIEEHYTDDVINGAYTVYYPNGGVELSGDYIDGEMNGQLQRYYESGNLMETVTMVDNNENGEFKEYYENGNIQWEGNYVNGENEVGLLKQYNESGDLIKKMMCDSLSICQTIWTIEKGDVKPINVFGDE